MCRGTRVLFVLPSPRLSLIIVRLLSFFLRFSFSAQILRIAGRFFTGNLFVAFTTSLIFPTTSPPPVEYLTPFPWNRARAKKISFSREKQHRRKKQAPPPPLSPPSPPRNYFPSSENRTAAHSRRPSFSLSFFDVSLSSWFSLAIVRGQETSNFLLVLSLSLSFTALHSRIHGCPLSTALSFFLSLSFFFSFSHALLLQSFRVGDYLPKAATLSDFIKPPTQLHLHISCHSSPPLLLLLFSLLWYNTCRFQLPPLGLEALSLSLSLSLSRRRRRRWRYLLLVTRSFLQLPPPPPSPLYPSHVPRNFSAVRERSAEFDRIPGSLHVAFVSV